MPPGPDDRTLPPVARPPAQPTYILRGHPSAIHGLAFYRNNTRLLTGDADGFVAVWDVAIKRPTVVWRAHEGAILGLEAWGDDRIITHGRDNSLRVWSLTPGDEKHGDFSKELPVEATTVGRKQPWLRHALRVSTLNFCGFASCRSRSSDLIKSMDNNETRDEKGDETEAKAEDSLLFAVPGAQDDQITMYHLPSKKLVGLIPAPNPQKTKAGMVMALKVFYRNEHGSLDKAPEESPNKHLIVLAGYESGRTSVFVQVPALNTWQEVYTNTPHKEPILSLDVAPSLSCFYTSAADGVIAKHLIGSTSSIRDRESNVDVAQEASKVERTKHSGQQSLRVRNDGKVFATAGWDARIRVYSAKTLKEVACCKWHREGCYAVAFGEVLDDNTPKAKVDTDHNALAGPQQTVAQAREERTIRTRWMAVGAKDGKVSLWNVF